MGKVLFKKLSEDAIIPYKAHLTDSGFDLFAAEDVVVDPGGTVVVPTNIAVQLPEGMEAQVRPRSGMTAKTKLRVQLGTIDNGYRGDIGIIVDNLVGNRRTEMPWVLDVKGNPYEKGRAGSYVIRKGDKIAQLVVQHLPDITVTSGDLTPTMRGDGGFGSSGYTDSLPDISIESRVSTIEYRGAGRTTTESSGIIQ